jgi:hypothetical protein
VTGITELVTGEHRRIVRLLAALDETARYAAPRDGRGPGPDWILAAMWARIADLLDLHADAELQVCYPAAFGCRAGGDREAESAIAVLDDLRAAVAETRLHDAGGPAWWRAVNAARKASTDHIAGTERGTLAEFHGRSGDQLHHRLGQQWGAFAAARRPSAARQASRGKPEVQDSEPVPSA